MSLPLALPLSERSVCELCGGWHKGFLSQHLSALASADHKKPLNILYAGLLSLLRLLGPLTPLRHDFILNSFSESSNE